MLLPDNIRPENTIYYQGAFVLELILKHKSIDLVDLFSLAKEKSAISFPVFVLCLDWLYLIDTATINKEGRVTLCS